MTVTFPHPKYPDAAGDYTINWAQWLDGDTIVTSTWNVPDGLTSGDEAHTATSATVWLEGGAPGASYELTNTITTLGGRVQPLTCILTMEEV